MGFRLVKFTQPEPNRVPPVTHGSIPEWNGGIAVLPLGGKRCTEHLWGPFSRSSPPRSPCRPRPPRPSSRTVFRRPGPPRHPWPAPGEHAGGVRESAADRGDDARARHGRQQGRRRSSSATSGSPATLECQDTAPAFPGDRSTRTSASLEGPDGRADQDARLRHPRTRRTRRPIRSSPPRRRCRARGCRRSPRSSSSRALRRGHGRSSTSRRSSTRPVRTRRSIPRRSPGAWSRRHRRSTRIDSALDCSSPSTGARSWRRRSSRRSLRTRRARPGADASSPGTPWTAGHRRSRLADAVRREGRPRRRQVDRGASCSRRATSISPTR